MSPSQAINRPTSGVIIDGSGSTDDDSVESCPGEIVMAPVGYKLKALEQTGKLWNSLPVSVFPPAYDFNLTKREVSRHLSSSIGNVLDFYYLLGRPQFFFQVGFFFSILFALGCLPFRGFLSGLLSFFYLPLAACPLM